MQGLLLALSLLNQCQPWHSVLVPPPAIRVLVDHHVERVPLRLYVVRVISSEWHHVPPQLRRAGAVAVRQYAWWKAMHPRRSQYGCFDVHNDTRDQIYRAKSRAQLAPELWEAYDSTIGWRLNRAGRLIQTGYRTGRAGLACGRDHDGYHLYARSAKRCANAGWGAARILRFYYGAHLRK